MDYLKNKQLFYYNIWNRGYDYFLDSRVTLTSEIGSDVSAVVDGSKNYQVNLHFSKNGTLLVAQCSCPYKMGFCKHEAAVLFALNEEHFHLEDLNDPIAENEFDAILNNLCMSKSKKPEEYFTIAKAIYVKNYQNWDEYYQTNGFLNIFFDAFDLFHPENLGDVFLSFVDDIRFNNRALKNIFDNFFRKVRYESWLKSFLLKAIPNNHLNPIIKSILSTKAYDYIYRPFVEVIYDMPSQVVPHLDDKTLLTILSCGNRNDKNPVTIIDLLMEEKRDKLLKQLITDTSVSLRADNEMKVQDYFVDQAYQRKDRQELEDIINTTDASFKALYCYYHLLDSKDQKRMAPQLQSVCNSLGYLKEFSIMTGENTSLNSLMGLSLENFIVLYPEIKMNYEGRYIKQLNAAIDKALNSKYDRDANVLTVFKTLDVYLDDAPELASNPKLNAISMTTFDMRGRYLALLKKHHALVKAGIHEYKLNAVAADSSESEN